MDWSTQINMWIYGYAMQADLRQDALRPRLGRMTSPRRTDTHGTMWPLHKLRHIKGYRVQHNTVKGRYSYCTSP